LWRGQPADADKKENIGQRELPDALGGEKKFFISNKSKTQICFHDNADS